MKKYSSITFFASLLFSLFYLVPAKSQGVALGKDYIEDDSFLVSYGPPLHLKILEWILENIFILIALVTFIVLILILRQIRLNHRKGVEKD